MKSLLNPAVTRNRQLTNTYIPKSRTDLMFGMKNAYKRTLNRCFQIHYVSPSGACWMIFSCGYTYILRRISVKLGAFYGLFMVPPRHFRTIVVSRNPSQRVVAPENSWQAKAKAFFFFYLTSVFWETFFTFLSVYLLKVCFV